MCVHLRKTQRVLTLISIFSILFVYVVLPEKRHSYAASITVAKDFLFNVVSESPLEDSQTPVPPAKSSPSSPPPATSTPVSPPFSSTDTVDNILVDTIVSEQPSSETVSESPQETPSDQQTPTQSIDTSANTNVTSETPSETSGSPKDHPKSPDDSNTITNQREPPAHDNPPTDTPVDSITESTPQPPHISLLDQIANLLFPSVTPILTVSITESLSTSTPLSRLWATLYPSVDAQSLDASLLSHRLLAAAHNAELQRITKPVVAETVSIPVEPHFPIFLDEAHISPYLDSTATQVLERTAAAEDFSDLGKLMLYSDRTHSSTEFTTAPPNTTSASPCKSSSPPPDYGTQPQPLLVLIPSADVPLEAVPRVIATLRARCPLPGELAVFAAPVVVALPPALAHATGALAAMLHELPDVEVAVAVEHRGMIAHAVNEVVRRKIQRMHSQRVQAMPAKKGFRSRLRYLGIHRVLVAHLAGLREYSSIPSTPTSSRDVTPSLPSIHDVLSLLAAPVDTHLSPRLCLAALPPVPAAALGLAALPLHVDVETLDPSILQVVAAEEARGDRAKTSSLRYDSPWLMMSHPRAATDAFNISSTSWSARTSPAAPAHLCTALLAMMHAPDAAPGSGNKEAVASLVRYNSLPLPAVPALTRPSEAAVYAAAARKALSRADALLLPLDVPSIGAPQRVAVFSSAATAAFSPPGFGVLANAAATAVHGAGPGYSSTPLLSLRRDELVRWGAVLKGCGTNEQCSDDESTLNSVVKSARLRLNSSETQKTMNETDSAAPVYDPLRTLASYSAKLTAAAANLPNSSLPVWPHAPQLLQPLLRLRDGRCLMSADFEAAVTPARQSLPLAAAFSPHLRGARGLWGFARVAAVVESMLSSVVIQGCRGILMPSDMPRGVAATPSRWHTPAKTLRVEREALMPLLSDARKLIAENLSLTLSALESNPSTPSTPASEAVPPAVIDVAVLVPTLGGHNTSPLRGTLLNRLSTTFLNDDTPQTSWSTEQLNGYFPPSVGREREIAAASARLVASNVAPEFVSNIVMHQLEELKATPLGTLVESIRDGMLLTRKYYQEAAPALIPPKVRDPPPLVSTTVWIGYDAGDTAWDTHKAEQELAPALALLIGELPIRVRLVRLQGYRSSPNWIWNSLAQRAYDGGSDYFLQVNDDVVYRHKHWLPHALQHMSSRYAPNVGVVGLISNDSLFTQALFSRRHVELSGGYTHPVFRNWFGDDYASYAYGGDRELNYGLHARLDNNVNVRYDTILKSPVDISELHVIEQSRLITYLSVFAPDAAAQYQQGVVSWAKDTFNLYIDATIYRNVSLHAY